MCVCVSEGGVREAGFGNVLHTARGADDDDERRDAGGRERRPFEISFEMSVGRLFFLNA